MVCAGGGHGHGHEHGHEDRTTIRRRIPAPATRTERGIFTFVEVLLATLILALSATATAYWVEMVGQLGADADEQTIALANVQVMEAMLTPLSFREPGGGVFGAEGGETLATFDDLDDFHGQAFAPPIDGNKQPQASLAGWQTLVTVADVDPATLLPDAGTDLRRVGIVVEHAGKAVAESWWLRARSPFE